jgi:acetyl-CoA acetyltransferase
MKNVVIAGYVRSPFHLARKGDLAKVRPDEMAGQVVKALIERTGVNPEDIEDLIMGCAFPEGRSRSPEQPSIGSVGHRCSRFIWQRVPFR